MRSFHKISDTRSTIDGTKLKNSLPLISSGIPSLDHVIGGGLPAGSIFAVEEDVLGNYSKIMIKYFLAEGVACKHKLLVASAEENPANIVKELPQPCSAPIEDDTSLMTSDVDKMKIAWRYEGLSQVESSFGTNTTFGHHFDLTKHIDVETLKSTDISYCDLTVGQDESKGFRNSLYYKLLSSIKKLVSKEEYRSNGKSSNILRISIQSLGSPIWLSMECDGESETSYGQELIKFMYCLRVLLRDTNAVAFVTIPGHLFDVCIFLTIAASTTSVLLVVATFIKASFYFYMSFKDSLDKSKELKGLKKDEHIMKRLLYSVDNAVRIESFAGSSRETNPVFKDYHGLFHITKLSALYSLVQFVPPSLDLAFKLKRKKFLIEKLHLPPELEESSEREQDDITATPSVNCGGFKKKDIDF